MRGRIGFLRRGELGHGAARRHGEAARNGAGFTRLARRRVGAPPLGEQRVPGEALLEIDQHRARLVVQRLLGEEVELLELRGQIVAADDGGGVARRRPPPEQLGRLRAGGIERQRPLGDPRRIPVAPTLQLRCQRGQLRGRLALPTGLDQHGGQPLAGLAVLGLEREDPPQVIDGPLGEPVLHEHLRLREDARHVAHRGQPRDAGDERHPGEHSRPGARPVTWPILGRELRRHQLNAGHDRRDCPGRALGQREAGARRGGSQRVDGAWI